MSLREALVYARAHQPSLAAARARVEVARAAAEVPRAQLGPKVTGAAELLAGTSNNTTASYATLGALDVARIGGTPANAPASWTPEPSTLVGVAVHKELYDFGRLELAGEALDALGHAADESAQSAQLDLDLLVENSFYAVLGAKAIEAASQAAVARAQTHRDLANAKVGAQLWPPIELTRADADLTRFQVAQIQAEGAVAVAESVLGAAVGASGAVDAGTDDLVFAEPAAADAATSELAARAPEIRAARDVLAAQQKITASVERELWPDLSVAAGLSGRAGGAGVAANASPPGDGWAPDVPNWDALVVFTWPLYDRSVDARARASRATERVRTEELAAITQAEGAIAQQASAELGVARAALPALQRALDAAQANHDQAEARFTSGLGTAVELSDAEALLTDAQIQLAIGQFHLSLARARLARALAESTP